MARKPLIDPNVLNQGPSTPLSTINRIIQKDREASGRSGPLIEPTVNEATREQVNQLTGSPMNERTDRPDEQGGGEPLLPDPSSPVTQITGEQVNPLTIPRNGAPSPTTGELTSGPVNKLTARERLAKAEETVERMAKSPNRQIGPRIPTDWDDWLEDYVYARRKSGLQKQELIRGLIRDFIVSELAKQGGEE